MNYRGHPIITSHYLTVLHEDWSFVRSPSRARRRRKRGHKQNIVHRLKPDPNVYLINGAYHMHPLIKAKLIYDNNFGLMQ